jgi:pimeloyl-ACP methyl ester carboxylesterase
MLVEVSCPVNKLFSFALLAFVCLSGGGLSATAQTPKVNVETGVLDNASYRIDMPEKWNGILIVYYHGYSEKPVVFDKDKPNEIGSLFGDAGYAVIQSGYSEVGLAIEHAVPETEALRRYAIAKYGQPKETYVTGHSMGGELTMITMESYPNRYDGALPLCGLLEPTTWAIGRASAMRAAFDYYYPGLLPGPIGIPATVELNDALVDKVLKALPGNPTGMAEMMALNGFKTKEDLAWGVVFATYIERDLEQKIGAPVMDNRNFIYTGALDDNALNDGVKRYTASDAALGYLKSWYTPTGILLKPTLAVHTTYDPIIPADSVRLYADLVQRNGSAGNFVQQYVKADGHCHFSDAETMAALDELIQWKHTGVRPDGGAVPVKAKQGSVSR